MNLTVLASVRYHGDRVPSDHSGKKDLTTGFGDAPIWLVQCRWPMIGTSESSHEKQCNSMNQQPFVGRLAFTRIVRWASCTMLCAFRDPLSMSVMSLRPRRSSRVRKRAKHRRPKKLPWRNARPSTSPAWRVRAKACRWSSNRRTSSRAQGGEATPELPTDATSTGELSDQPSKARPQEESKDRPSDGRRSPGDQPLVIFCWPGYVPQSVTDAFTKETGIEVLREYYNTQRRTTPLSARRATVRPGSAERLCCRSAYRT